MSMFGFLDPARHATSAMGRLASGMPFLPCIPLHSSLMIGVWCEAIDAFPRLQGGIFGDWANAASPRTGELQPTKGQQCVRKVPHI